MRAIFLSSLSWEGTDDMEKYRIPRLVEWKDRRKAMSAAGSDRTAFAYEDDHECVGSDHDSEAEDGTNQTARK